MSQQNNKTFNNLGQPEPTIASLKDKIRFKTPQRYVLILWGEAFRQNNGHQKSREIDNNPKPTSSFKIN